MKIDHLVEGSTDRALIRGLHRQLCPDAELVEGHFRGSINGVGRKRELASACAELDAKDVDVIVDVNDANEMTWHQRRDQERSWIPPQYHHKVAVGCPEPNISAWLIADAGHFQRATGSPCRPKPEDPKPLTDTAFHVTGIEKREMEIAEFVAEADLAVWRREDRSFDAFAQECREIGRALACTLRER